MLSFQEMITYAPVATLVLISTIAISLHALYNDQQLLYRMMLHPYSVFRNKQYELLVTHGFIHADIAHLAFNMFTFYFFGIALELHVGHIGFIIVYFGSMLASALITSWQRKNNEEHRSLGASGAVSGALLGFILFQPTASLYMMFIPIPIPAWLFAIAYIGYSYYASQNQRSRIDHAAHLWGAVAGVVLTLLIKPSALGTFISQMFG
ncbi:MAG: rhomboid family intramembrane serine protease [Calditrichia bacterium]